jgi:hypothetical protein
MPLQDVSNDQSMMDWLRQSGHGHLLDERSGNAINTSSSSSPPPPPFLSNLLSGQTTSSSNYPPQTTSSNYPPQAISSSSPPPIFGGGFSSSGPQMDTLNRSASFPRTDFLQTSSFGGGAGSSSPPIIPSANHFTAPSLDYSSSPLNFNPSPTQFLSSNANQQKLDADIEVKYLL